ncbi:hypothetical protein WJX72_000667 [[Myrmecia] bisecta]|uniref:Glycosyltransferase 61 catalytic domain-containing protein n=1 Tax=[Myrmecia] bisecta TaxID=41462 RepID=A0AAW1Q0D0_9CHLO
MRRGLMGRQARKSTIHLAESRGRWPGSGRTTVPPVIDAAKLEYHGCVALEQVCVDQGRFVVFSPVKQPGHKDFVEHLFDPGFTWLNTPGQPEHFLGTKLKTPWPHMRSNSTADPVDIASPAFSPHVVPLVWYPVHAESYREAVLQSLAPLHAMQLDGAVDRNITLVPMLNGFNMPEFFAPMLAPFTNNPIETLEDVSSREHMTSPLRSRCFQKLLMCKPFNLFNYRNEGEGKTMWFQALHPGTTGQQVVDFYQPQLKPAPFDEHVLKVAVVKTGRKRRILNLNQVVTTCSAWRPADPDLRLDCVAYDFEQRLRERSFVGILAELQGFDILMGMHGEALANGIFMAPNTSVVEVRPCEADSDWLDNYFQRTLRIDNLQLAFKLVTQSRELCFPSDLQLRGDRAGLDEDGLEAVFKQDQDLHIKPAALEALLALVVDKVGGDLETYLQRLQQDPTFGNTLVQ